MDALARLHPGTPGTPPVLRRTSPVFPTRKYAAGGHTKLPAARAWRIVPRAAAEFAAASPAVAAGAPQAPVGCADGVYPVWVKLTEPTGRELVNRLLMVDGAGWQFEPTGPGWHIEAVSGAGADGQRFTFVVETVTDERHAQPIVPDGGVSARNVSVVGMPLVVPPLFTETVMSKVYGKPVAGASQDVALAAGDANVATVAGRLLRLTAVDGDAFYAVDADASNAANRVLLLQGATDLVAAGNALHYCQGPNAGGRLYVAQFIAP